MADPKILDEQGILLFNLNLLTRNRKTGLSRAERGIQETRRSSNETEFIPTGGPGFYPNVCLLDSTKPGQFLSYLKNRSVDDKNAPKKKKIISDTLLKMSTFELSSLVPVVRLFKIIHNPLNGKEITVELPFETKADGIESIFLNNTGRGVGAGITSVEWKHAPKFEAQAPIFDLIIRLHLQNVEEFFKTKNAITLNDGKTVARVSIQDLMYQPKELRKITGEGTSTYNPDYYKIKLIVGWAISDSGLESIRNNSTREDIDAFIAALKEQTEVMYLTFVNHDIQFNDDGSIDLQLNYFGSAEVEAMDLSKSNVLTTGFGFESEIKEAEKKLKEAKNKAEENVTSNASKYKKTESDVGLWTQFSNWVEDVDLNPFDDNAARQKKSDERDAELAKGASVRNAEQNLENLKKSAKKRKYTYMVRRMLEKKHIHLFLFKQESIEIYSQMRSNLNVKDGITERAIQNLNDATAATRTRASRAETPTLEAPADSAGTDNAVSYNEGEVTAQKNGTPSISDDEANKKDDELINSIMEGDFANNVTLPTGVKHLPYFHLSSLVDVLLEGIYDTNKNNPSFISKSLRTILGPITIVDYGCLVHNGQIRKIPKTVDDEKGKIVKTYTGTPTTINIGDLPISLKAFTSWFKTNIMDKNLEEISLNEFMTTLMQELVINSLSNDVYSFAPPQKINLVTDMFSAVTSKYNEGMFIANIQRYCWIPSGVAIAPLAGGFRIDVSKMKSLRTDFNDFNSEQKPKNYIILYSSTEIPEDGNGEITEDSKKGIYHFYYGESRGIIRNIKFSRTDNPYVRTDAVINSNGNRTGGIVREKYNVNLEIFGNTDIQAGTYIYLAPSFQGNSRLADTERLFKDIGLGGYYFVTEVHNTIEIGEFVTKIKAVWQTSGDGSITSNVVEQPGSTTGNQSDYIVDIEVV